MSAAVDYARQEWEESHRRLEEAAGDRARYAQLLDGLEIVTDELTRRIGQTFTLAELAREYRAADTWAQQALADAAPREATRSLPVVTGAAFHLYARGAVDYAP